MSNEEDDALDGDELVNDRWFWGRDGAGQPVDPVSVTKAVKAWSELWGNALFDCGPQNYEYMAKEIVRVFDLVDELEDRLDLPEVQRRRNEPTVSLADVKKELDL